MSLTFGTNSSTDIYFAKARIIGVKDEDRDSVNLRDKFVPVGKHFPEEQNQFDDLSSFSVFDGHGGKRAATICEQKLFAATNKSYIDSTVQLLPKATVYSTSLCDEDIVDALLVNAIHDGIEAVHEASVKESETAGTTMCSLFLIPVDHQKHVHGMRQSDPWQPTQADVAAAEMGVAADCGRSYKVLCANIGDSRCVMVGCSAEPIKVVRKGVIISRGNSANNLAAMAAEGKASPQAQPTLSLSPTARTSPALSSHNLFASDDENKGSNSPNNSSRIVWNMQSPKESDSSAAALARSSTDLLPKKTIVDRFKRYLNAYSRTEDDGLNPSSHMDSTNHSAGPLQDDQMEEDLPAAGATMQVCVRAVAMCEDHKPSNKRERFRVEKRLKIGQQVLPVPLKAFDQSDEDFVQLYCHRFFGQSPLPAKPMGKPLEDSTSFKRRFEAFVKEEQTTESTNKTSSGDGHLSCLFHSVDLHNPISSTSELWPRFTNQLLIDFQSPIFGGNIRKAFLWRLYEAAMFLQRLLGDKGSSKAEEHETEVTAAQNAIRAESCFKIRTGSDGTIGPEAFFPRFSNNSLLMTRSVGDKSGPRGCLARADITSVTVHSTQHARFVLASDGVWDVIDEELVRKMGLYYKYKDPRDFAVYLAEKALKRRTKLKLSKDDITVFVIDLNPQNAVFIKTPDSKEDGYYPAYHVDAAKKLTPMKSSVFSGPPATLSSKKVSPQGVNGENAISITTVDIADYSNNPRCNQS